MLAQISLCMLIFHDQSHAPTVREGIGRRRGCRSGIGGAENRDRDRIIDEMRWGNGYFLKMQEPDGYLMSYCGGDDGNTFTDNVTSTRDDRRIHVEPADLPEQFHFIAAQAALAASVRTHHAIVATTVVLATRRSSVVQA